MPRPILAAVAVVALLALTACSAGPDRKWSEGDYLNRLHAEGLTKVTTTNVENFSTGNCSQLRDAEKSSPAKGALASVLALGMSMNLKDIEASKTALETVTTEYCPDLTGSVAAVNSASA
jgi:hypothetical protein